MVFLRNNGTARQTLILLLRLALTTLSCRHQEQVINARQGSVTFWPGSSPVLAYRELHKARVILLPWPSLTFGPPQVWDRERRDYTKTVGGTGLIPDAWVGPGLKRTLNGSLTKPPAYTHDYLVK